MLYCLGYCQLRKHLLTWTRQLRNWEKGLVSCFFKLGLFVCLPARGRALCLWMHSHSEKPHYLLQMISFKSLPKPNQIQPHLEVLLLVHSLDRLSETAETIGLMMFYHVHPFNYFSTSGYVSDHHPLKSLAWTFSLVSSYFTSSWVSICKRFSPVSGLTSLTESEISVAALFYSPIRRDLG